MEQLPRHDMTVEEITDELNAGFLALKAAYERREMKIKPIPEDRTCWVNMANVLFSIQDRCTKITDYATIAPHVKRAAVDSGFLAEYQKNHPQQWEAETRMHERLTEWMKKMREHAPAASTTVLPATQTNVRGNIQNSEVAQVIRTLRAFVVSSLHAIRHSLFLPRYGDGSGPPKD